HIIVHPKCVNFITEISNYSWEKDALSGKPVNRPCDNLNHLMDAMRYAMEDLGRGNYFSFE
ncbi:MAG: PBSX family phage terminase large subunit, partial [Ruminiclostridium sp.]|nr:PBSX family phage terminase large subunit [Ruminiclostridium sp.]